MGMAIPESAAEAVELLGVAPGADAAAVRKRYRELAMRFHPDLNPDDPQADQRMAELNRARDLLADGVPLDVLGVAGASASPPQPPAASRPRSPAERAEVHSAFQEQMERERRVDNERRRRRQAARRRERREAEARAQRAAEESRRAAAAPQEGARGESRRGGGRAARGRQAGQGESWRAREQAARGAQAGRGESRQTGERPVRGGQSGPGRAAGRRAEAGQGPARRARGGGRAGSEGDGAGAAGRRRAGRVNGASAASSPPLERVCEALSARGWEDAVAAVRARYSEEGAVAPASVEFVLSVMRDGALFDAALVVAAPGMPLAAPLLDHAMQRASEEGAPFAFAMNERMFRRAIVWQRTRTNQMSMAEFPSPEELLEAFEGLSADEASGGGERGPRNFGRLFRR